MQKKSEVFFSFLHYLHYLCNEKTKKDIVATKKQKRQYTVFFIIVVALLAAVRLIFPGVAGTLHASADETLTADNGGDDHQASLVKWPTAAALNSFAKRSATVHTATESPAVALHAATESPVAAPKQVKKHSRKRFWNVNDYGKVFADSNHVQLEAARQWGVPPVRNRDDAEQRKSELVYMAASPYYNVAKLDASIPYLVPRAAILLDDIGRLFFDSLQARGYDICFMTVSSVLRTEEDVARLRRSNKNATEQSCHLYGTTFDINYNIYTTLGGSEVNDNRLKDVLADVLYDLHEQQRCYVKYEVQQPCFHITVK